MKVKSRSWFYGIIVEDAQRPKVHLVGVLIVCKREMMIRGKPVRLVFVVLICFYYFYHGWFISKFFLITLATFLIVTLLIPDAFAISSCVFSSCLITVDKKSAGAERDIG